MIMELKEVVDKLKELGDLPSYYDSDNIVPNSGVGGFAPIPKKPKVANSKMALEIPIVICTMRGARQFGKMTINIKRNTLAPATRCLLYTSRCV